jgi:hypothetical protein
VVLGYLPNGDEILHMLAESTADLGKALLDLAGVAGVTEIVTLALQAL